MKQLKILLSSLVLFSFFGNVYSQVGIGTTTPEAALDITSTNQGLLIPRVSLTATNDVATVLTPTISELVYNTNTSAVGSNQVTPGYYYWDGSLWIRLAPGGSNNGWSILGNAGLSSAANFLGTTDDIDVAFRREDLAAGRIGATSTSFGLNALTSGTATNSTAFGNSALAANTTGEGNAAFGTGALSNNTNRNNSTAVGFNALNVSTNAGNSAFGSGALIANVNGTNNTAIGLNAGSNVTGSSNIIIGANINAPVANGPFQLNIGNTIYGNLNPTSKRITIGGSGTPAPEATLDVRALNATSTTATTVDGILIPRISRVRAQNMASTPTSTIIYITEVTSGTATGTTINVTSPGFYFYNGTVWVQFATGALTGWATAGNAGLDAATNFLGTIDAVDVAFRRNNAAAGRIGATSTSFGVSALAANTGANNTAFGVNALAANNSPGDNTAIGYNALAANTINSGSGNFNTAVGSGALDALNGGARNTAVGANALTGVNGNASLDNVAIGYNSLPGGGTIDQSVAIGSNALSASGTGSTRSTAIGFNAGNNITQSIESVIIGSNSQGFGSTARNQIVIGYNASASGDNQVTLGNGSITTLRCSATTITALSDRRDKTDIVQLTEGIEFIKKLNPVSYTWNTRDTSKVGIKAAGFIAQDLLHLQQNSSIGENLDLVSYDNPDRFEARYGNLLPIMIKGMQEQQEQIEELKKTNAELLKMNELILKRLEALEKK
jgi:trimeric autotransporter adhesin